MPFQAWSIPSIRGLFSSMVYRPGARSVQKRLGPWPQQTSLQTIKTIGNGFITCDDNAGMTPAWQQEGCYVPGTPDTLPALLPQMLGPWISWGPPWRAALARAHPSSCEATLELAKPVQATSTTVDQTLPGPACQWSSTEGS